MTSFDRFERNLPDLLEALAAPRRPDYAEDLFTRTAATRQRPGWSFPERWLPVSALSRSLAGVPRVPWRIGALVALLVVASLLAVLVAGALLNRTPPPYGPATNGRIVFIDTAGRLVTGDLATGTSTIVVEQPGSGSPIYAQDGSRIAYLQRASASAPTADLMVVAGDGTNVRKLSEQPIVGPQYVGWSGRGDRILVVDGASQLLMFDSTRTGPPVNLSGQLGLGRAAVGLGFNFRSTAAFQPPNGDEILFLSQTGGDVLKVVRPDGTGLRTLLDGQSSPVAYTQLAGAEWSPDGSQIVVMLEFPGQPDRLHIHVLNADGTGLHPISAALNDRLAGQNSPLWSPDGTRIAFQNWTGHASDDGQDYHPIGIADVVSGTVDYVGPTNLNGYVSWEWSPDGSSILEVPQDGSGTILVIDASSGAITTAPWKANQPISWQRVAR
jgi:hypothetical protein